VKRTLAALFGIGLLCMGAQAGGLGVFGSYWNPDEGDSVWGAGALLRGGVGPFYLGVRGTYYEDISEALKQPVVDLQAIPVDASVGLQWAPIDDLELYGGGGATYYFLDTRDGKVDDEVGLLLEAGVELTITSHIGVFGQAVWRDVRGTVEDDRIGDINRHRADINLDGVTVNVGLVFR
jgi:hypothetical protein